jgi:hypothetical protein
MSLDSVDPLSPLQRNADVPGTPPEKVIEYECGLLRFTTAVFATRRRYK